MSTFWALECQFYFHQGYEALPKITIGICLVIYLDNMLILAQTRDELLKWRSVVLDLL